MARGKQHLGPAVPSYDSDPFFGSQTIHATGVPYYDAWRVRELAKDGTLARDGYKPGDWIPITWEEPNGNSARAYVQLPSGYWNRDSSWSDLYSEYRDFFYGEWGGPDSPPGSSMVGGE